MYIKKTYNKKMENPNSYLIEVMDRKEINKLVELFLIVWGGNYEKVLSKTKWAFDNDDSIVFIARNPKTMEIIGARGAIFWPIKVGDKIINTYQFHGTCVHPDHQRKGLFTRLNKVFLQYAKNNNIYGVFNVSVEASMLGYIKLGWKYLPGFKRIVKIPNIFRLIKSIINNNLNKAANEDSDCCESVTLDCSPEELDRFIQVRDNRLSSNKLPFCYYTVDSFTKRISDKNSGYRFYKTSNILIIYKNIKKRNLDVLLIGEIFFINEEISEIRKSLEVITFIQKPDLVLAYISVNHPNYKILRKCGFLSTYKNDMRFGTRIIDNKCINYFGDIIWQISDFDIDTF